jgi:hypothetical protein
LQILLGQSPHLNIRNSRGYEEVGMTALDWVFTSIFFALYLCLLFTVCVMTFQKGHTVLGIVGIFIPFLWLIGAILPPRPGSRYQREEAIRYQTMTSQLPQ